MRVTTSSGNAGHDLSKTIKVDTSDPENPQLELKIYGKVKPYVTVSPRRVILKGRQGESIAQTVKIFPETDEGLNITGLSAARGVDIDYRLSQIRENGKNGYALHVENQRDKPGRFYDTVFLKTDSDVAGTISIVVSGLLRPAGPGKTKQ